jgi:hypothetical protein
MVRREVAGPHRMRRAMPARPAEAAPHEPGVDPSPHRCPSRPWANVAPIRSRPVGLAPHPGAASLAADQGLTASTVDRDAAARADPARWCRPSGVVRFTPDGGSPGAGHRWQLDATAAAAIRADQRLEPGVDVGTTHPVGHDDGPSLLGIVPPAHVTEFRRNGVITGNSAARVSAHAVRGDRCRTDMGTPVLRPPRPVAARMRRPPLQAPRCPSRHRP